MLKTNNIYFQKVNISVDVAKCGKIHKYTQYTHFCLLQNITRVDWKIYSWQGSNSLGCPVMLRRNYSCVQSLLSVAKFTQLLTFYLLQKCSLHWTIYSWQVFNSLGCPLMQRTNYRCVQWLNISVDFAKCVENVHKFTQYTHFLSVQKRNCPHWTIY